MIGSLPPGSVLILGALLVPLLRAGWRQAFMLLLPLISMAHLLSFPAGYELSLALFGYELTPIRVDRLSLVWGYIFHIAAFLSVLYALHVRDRVQDVAGLMYAGSAIAAARASMSARACRIWPTPRPSSTRPCRR